MLLALSSAVADQRTALERTVNHPEFLRGIISAAKNSDVVLANPCPSARFTVEGDLTMLKPLTLDDTDRISSGSWMQGVKEEGCGSVRLLNVLVSIEPPDQMRLEAILPGGTHADPRMQKVGVKEASRALESAGAVMSSCDTGYVADTEFVGEDKDDPLPGTNARGWRESWTIISCHQKAVVPMHFVPDAAGTTIVAEVPQSELPN
jgi:hypothetical protein